MLDRCVGVGLRCLLLHWWCHSWNLVAGVRGVGCWAVWHCLLAAVVWCSRLDWCRVLKTKSGASIVCGFEIVRTLGSGAEVSRFGLRRACVTSSRSTCVCVLGLERSAILRLCRMSHRCLQQGLIITTSFDKLLIELSEFICIFMSEILGECRSRTYLSSANTCQSTR